MSNVRTSLIALSLAALMAGQAYATPQTYLGVDISYANEMEDCGAVYRSGGKTVSSSARATTCIDDKGSFPARL